MLVDLKLIKYKFAVGSTKLDPIYLNNLGLLMTTTLFVSISVCVVIIPKHVLFCQFSKLTRIGIFIKFY